MPRNSSQKVHIMSRKPGGKYSANSIGGRVTQKTKLQMRSLLKQVLQQHGNLVFACPELKQDEI